MIIDDEKLTPDSNGGANGDENLDVHSYVTRDIHNQENNNKKHKKNKKSKKLIALLLVLILIAILVVGIYKHLHRPSINDADAQFSSLGNDKNSLVNGDNNNPNWESVAKSVKKSVVSIISSQETMFGESTASGSGMIINSSKGYILTNNHVVANGKSLQVSLYNGQEYTASIIGTDPEDDLAVIKLKDAPNNLSQVEFADSQKVTVGQPSMAVGSPLGLDQTVTVGIISAINRPVTTANESSEQQTNEYVVTNALQTDTAINPGNSGGPLFDGEGKVIGVNSSIASLSQGFGGGQSGNIGIGFAIPSNLASYVADNLSTSGKVAHSFLGVTLKDKNVTIGKISRTGAEIQTVVNNSSADAAGLKNGDVIIGIDSHPTNSSISLTAFIRSYPVNSKIKITFVRNGSTKEVSVTLKKK